MVITRDRFFDPILTQIMDSFSCSPSNTVFYVLKQILPDVPEYAEMRHDIMTVL